MFVFLLPVLTKIGGWLSSTAVSALLKGYSIHMQNADNADSRTADLAARELAVEQREAELNSALLLKDEDHWYSACIRPLFAAPFIIFNFKLIVWDKVFASWTHGVTDALSPDLLKLEGLVIGFYFAGRTLEKVSTILKRK